MMQKPLQKIISRKLLWMLGIFIKTPNKKYKKSIKIPNKLLKTMYKISNNLQRGFGKNKTSC